MSSTQPTCPHRPPQPLPFGQWGTWLPILLCVLFPLFANAMHIIGGEITYEYLGETATGVRYRFTMKIYRDCNGGGAPFDNQAKIAIYRGTYNNNVLVTNFSTTAPVITRLTPIPPECISSIPNVCVEQGVYTFERVLPLTNQSYFIVYQRCCRNNTINNIVDPGDVGATYFTELTPEAQVAKNNSPVFKNFPPIIICNNFPLKFDHVATDADGDFLVYSFCTPHAGGGPILTSPGVSSCGGAVPDPPCSPPFDPVPFTEPTYDAQNPMGGNPKVSINPATGFISGTPNRLGQFVVGVCVDEYRNGVKLSTLKRDFQFNVADCQPTVIANIKEDTILGPKSFLVTACGATSVTIQNESVDRSKISYFEWRFDLKGTSFKDSTNWNTTIAFPDTGIYVGKLLLNPGKQCGDTATIYVNIHPEVKADYTFRYDTCLAGPVSFTDKSAGIAGLKSWRWAFGNPGGTSTERNPSYLYPQPGNYPARLRVTDYNGCTDDQTYVISWFPAPQFILVEPNTFSGCAPADILFKNLSTPIDSTYKILWDFGDGTTLKNVISPVHRYENPGLYDVSVAITSPFNCFISDSFPQWIRVNPTPKAAFDCDPDSLLSNLNNTVRFTDQSVDASRWEWFFGKSGKSTQRNPVYTFPDTGLVTVRQIVTHPSGCRDTLDKLLDIRPEIRWFMPNAFTPNGDGTNEGFLGKGFLYGVRDFSLSIWNRWGEKVFQTNDPEEDWNGRVNNTGGMSPPGVYVYLVNIIGPRGERLEYKGFATIVQ